MGQAGLFSVSRIATILCRRGRAPAFRGLGGVIVGYSARSGGAVLAAKPAAHVWWIDDLGRWNSIQDLGCNRDPILDSKLGAQMMYCFYGMVRIEEGCPYLVCSWDVRCVCWGALEAAASYLCKAGRPVKLRFYFGGWQEERFSDARLACQRLMASRLYARTEPLPGPCIMQRPLAEARATQGAVSKLLHLMEASQGRFTPALHQTLQDHRLLRRLVLLEEDARQGRLIVKYIGHQSVLARFYGEQWAEEALGKPLEQLHLSINPLRSLLKGYRSVLETGDARFDHVRLPLAIRSEELHWIGYKRLIVPYSLETGGRGVMSLSKLSRSLALPFMGWLLDGPAYCKQRAA